ncbi:MAG: hypothetical protein JXJ19_09890 [Elusimicrobia bacterium]|nr:hypothetical protein [Elusimicrobiota bacterium]
MRIKEALESKARHLVLITYVTTLILPGSLMATGDPYSYVPSQIYKPGADELFREAKKLIDVAPLRPLVVRDKKGNIMFTTSTGEVMVGLDTSGNMTFSLAGIKHHARDAQGNLTAVWEREKGSNKVYKKNEFGEVTGIEEHAMGGKTVAEYDEDGNKTKSYQYNRYGKSMEWVVDELTQSKTKFDSKGNAEYDVNFEGHIMARYRYDSAGRLEHKVDSYGNRTYFDKTGNMTRTVDMDGNTMVTYNYRKDANGNTVLSTVKDEMSGNVTIYKDNKPQEVRNNTGAIIQDYHWQGTKLIYTENLESGEVTWYKNGERTYTTYEGKLVTEWMYHEGKLVGVWNVNSSTLTLYTHGREEVKLMYDEMPSVDEVLDLYKERGLGY